MNLRTDGFRMAGWKRAASIGARTDVAQSIIDDPTPIAELGDVWIVRVVVAPESEEEGVNPWTSASDDDGPIVGYALTCPNTACRFGVHDWTWANNCGQKLPDGGPRCVHVRDRVSCWQWSGSIEDNSLTATPSLHSPVELGGCGFHGFLKSGVLA